MRKDALEDRSQRGIGGLVVFALFVSIAISTLLTGISANPQYRAIVGLTLPVCLSVTIFLFARYVIPGYWALLVKYIDTPLLIVSFVLYIFYQGVCAASLGEMGHGVERRALIRGCIGGCKVRELFQVPGWVLSEVTFLAVLEAFYEVVGLTLLFYPVIGGPVYILLVIARKIHSLGGSET